MIEPLPLGAFPTPLEEAEPGSRVVFLHSGGLPGLFRVDQPVL
jgi:1-aminocyclopropane-1-carboxylate deaminase/D-cysteine desulfhydrase-like pyridoxal-dependent ACC family enzyme